MVSAPGDTSYNWTLLLGDVSPSRRFRSESLGLEYYVRDSYRFLRFYCEAPERRLGKFVPIESFSAGHDNAGGRESVLIHRTPQKRTHSCRHVDYLRLSQLVNGATRLRLQPVFKVDESRIVFEDFLGAFPELAATIESRLRNEPA